MKPIHLLITLLVVAVWGVNFVVIKIGLNEMSPLVFCTIRFILASLPAVFLVKRPQVPLKYLALYGVIMFAVQFGLLFTALQEGITAGLASLLLQLQAFFTIVLAVLWMGERPNRWQVIGGMVAFLGLAIVFANLGSEISMTGLLLVVAAAAAWGISNIIAKNLGHINMFSLIIWGSLFAWPPLLAMTLLMEGTDSITFAIHHMTWLSAGAIFYNVFPVTLFGFGTWNWLLSKYPAATIAPFTLLVPITGFLSSIIVYDEPLQAWKWLATAFIILGLCINVLGPRYLMKKRKGESDFASEKGSLEAGS